MKLKFWVLLLVTVVIIGGCKEKETQPNSNEEDSYYKWKVKTEFHEEEIFKPVIYKNTIIQCYGENETDYVAAFQLSDGKLIWKNNSSRGQIDNWFYNANVMLHKNVLMICTESNFYAIDVETGKTLWFLNEKYNNNINCHENSIYTILGKGESSTCVRFDLYTGEKTEVYKVTKDKEGEGISSVQLSTPVFYQNQNGDELIAFFLSRENLETNQYFAVNTNTDQIEWKNDRVLDNEYMQLRPILTDGNIYFYGSKYIFCLDAITGKELWSYRVKLNGATDGKREFKVHNNTLVFIDDNYNIGALNLENGKELWINDDTRYFYSSLDIIDNTVWIGNGAILAYDLSTGKQIMNWSHVVGNYDWTYHITSDPNTGDIYTRNHIYLFCLNPDGMK